MKKLMLSALTLLCLSGLVSCAGKPDETANIIVLKEVSGLVTEKGYTEEDLSEKLIGCHRDDIVASWGEPDGMLSGFRGNIWKLSDESDQQIILYYDKEGIVEDIKIGECFSK